MIPHEYIFFRKVFFPNLSRSGLNDNACVRFVSAANVHFQGCRAPLSDSSFGPHCMRTTCSCKVSFPCRRGLVCLGNKFSTRHSISPVTDERALAQACGDFSLLLCACVCVPPPLPPSSPVPPPPILFVCGAVMCSSVSSPLVETYYGMYICLFPDPCQLHYWVWSTHILGLGSVLVYFVE